MLVLHGACHDGRFLLWGEVGEAQSPPAKRGEAQKAQSLNRLPCDAGGARLRAALTGLGAPAAGGRPRPGKMVAWLPTRGGVPLASSPLVGEPPASRAKPVIAPWSITALPLRHDDAVDFLCACAGRKTLGDGLVIGGDLACWSEAMRFAGALVARQRFLPGVAEGRDAFRARWEPLFTGPDADRLAMLARAMPSACRALTRSGASPPDEPALAVLEGFIFDMVDHLVRSSAFEEGMPAGPASGQGAKGGSQGSVHDQWLHALGSPDGSMTGEAEALGRFASQVREWKLPISAISSAPFRLCFRLEEPEDAGDGDGGVALERAGWYVRYLLQAADDPSLLVPANDAWEVKGRKKALFKRSGFNAREHLLASLGQASCLCPRVEASLKTQAPGGYETDVEGAYEFLTEKAMELEQAGFGVMLPSWWTRKGTKRRLSVRAKVKSPGMQAGGGISLADLVSFQWEVALGGEKLSLADLKTLARMKAPLVKVRGQWTHVSATEIQAALDLWKKKGADTATLGEVVQMALGRANTPSSISFEGVSAGGWIAGLLDRLEGRTSFEELPAPGEFAGTMRPYQVRGYSWLCFLRQWGLGACLADDMGLGKTIQALALIQRCWHDGIGRPTLVICPTSVVANWRKEAARFTPELPVMVHHGTKRRKGATFEREASKSAIVISSYALLRRDLKTLENVGWSGVILDEAQNIKNAETGQARAARALGADYRVAMTGTPVENNVGDLWSIMEFLNPGFLGTRAEFKRSYFIPIQANLDPAASEGLQRLTGPFILRRLKTDRSIIDDLPEKMEMKVFCTLTREQASLYAAVVEEAAEALEDSEGIGRKGIVLATLMKLKQACNHPRQLLGDNSPIAGRSGKLARLTEMLEEVIEEGDRALVFSQFAEMGELLKRHLQETFGGEVLFLHGAVPRKKRELMIERFQADGDGPSVFVLSLKAGGTGLNLTRASHVFHFDRWWNPAVEDQATDRAFRIGQEKNVQVHKFICAGTLEERIDQMIERKKEVAGLVVGAGEGWLTRLSNDELKDIFTLGRDAVAE